MIEEGSSLRKGDMMGKENKTHKTNKPDPLNIIISFLL